MTGGLSPEARRRTAARAAGHARVLAAGSKAAVSAPARAAFLARFEHQVDPEGTLPPERRKELADAALSLHMSRLALRRGGKARTKPQKKKEKEKKPAPPVEAPAPPMSWARFLAGREAAMGPADGTAQAEGSRPGRRLPNP